MKLCISVSLSVILILTTLTSFSQRRVTAKVVDKETKKPLTDASVRIVGTDITTTTNSTGFFQLTIDSLKDLVIASPGYDTGWVVVPTSDKFLINLTKSSIVPENLVTQQEDSDRIFMVVDEPAEFTGGLKALGDFLASHLTYPIEARKMGIEGVVFVSFVIDKAGVID